MAFRKTVWVDGNGHKNGGYHMIRNDAFEPQRKNNFELHISGLKNFGETDYYENPGRRKGSGPANSAGVYNTFSINNNGEEEIITLSVKSFDPPNFTTSPLVVSYGNNKVKYAGVPEFASSNLVINDFIGAGTIEILNAWQRRVYDVNSETIGLSSEYKMTAYLYEFAPNGDLHRSWEIAGLWPSNVNYGNFSQEDAGLREVTATLEYDYCKPSAVSGGHFSGAPKGSSEYGKR